jgi:hypothetical protein
MLDCCTPGRRGFLTGATVDRNLAGLRFSKLVALSRSSRTTQYPSYTYWNCLCDCGSRVEIMAKNLVSGHTKSCGCLMGRTTRHGHCVNDKKTSEYHSWRSMIDRCVNRNTTHYAYYGGRGITVCDRWLHSFENFLADMGRKPTPRHTIERINTNGNYELENCCWATRVEQQRNRRDSIQATIENETMSVYQWCERFNVVSPRVAIYRIKHGIDPLTAFTAGRLRKRTKLQMAAAMTIPQNPC